MSAETLPVIRVVVKIHITSRYRLAQLRRTRRTRRALPRRCDPIGPPSPRLHPQSHAHLPVLRRQLALVVADGEVAGGRLGTGRGGGRNEREDREEGLGAIGAHGDVGAIEKREAGGGACGQHARRPDGLEDQREHPVGRQQARGGGAVGLDAPAQLHAAGAALWIGRRDCGSERQVGRRAGDEVERTELRRRCVAQVAVNNTDGRGIGGERLDGALRHQRALRLCLDADALGGAQAVRGHEQDRADAAADVEVPSRSPRSGGLNREPRGQQVVGAGAVSAAALPDVPIADQPVVDGVGRPALRLVGEQRADSGVGIGRRAVACIAFGACVSLRTFVHRSLRPRERSTHASVPTRGNMPRPILPEDRIHPAIREKIATNHADVVAEVQAALDANEFVVVGMAQNPHVAKARKALQAAGKTHHYLEYGSYVSQWRRRNALKMWTGWPTFPMVFHRGVLIGGASDLATWLGSSAS